jgi:glycosyltransferase involved in cell wall biosynthesis
VESSSPPVARQRIAVCALTLGRPVGLATLLAGLAELEVPDGVEVVVVIVDNDPEGSAREVVDAWRSRLPFETTFVVEPRRGIPFARNTAVATADGADFVAFIDDDEVPDPRWLAELLRVQRATGSAVVASPVVPRFEEPPPAWIVAGGFFEKRRFADGGPAPFATTSSVLIARRAFPPGIQPFNEKMALTGGTDTHFFMRAQLQGHAISWADKAPVTETIPATRANLRWLLRRQYRRGLVLTMSMLDLRGSPVRRLRRVLNGLVNLGQGLGLVVLGSVKGRITIVRGLQRLWFGAGLLAGLAGARYEEYRTIHGR